jgi:hypothetical protein
VLSTSSIWATVMLYLDTLLNDRHSLLIFYLSTFFFGLSNELILISFVL